MQIKAVVSIWFFITCFQYAQSSLINTSHLDHLYEKVKAGNSTFGIVHIYSEAPDYNWVGDEDEGIACIDDAARAAVFYMKHYSVTKKIEDLDKIKGLIDFSIYMQSNNGFFYNFIWKDYTPNKEFRTSIDQPSWWSWRSIWALSEGALFFKSRDKKYYNKIIPVLKRSVSSTLAWLSKENKTVNYGGYELPGWLPYETASDQAAIIVKGLLNYYILIKDEDVKKTIVRLCDGLLEMQKGDKDTPPFNCFFSWQNTWHAWGNSQSDALLEAGKLLGENRYIEAAEREINNFYRFLFDHGYYNSLSFTKEGSKSEISDSSKFSQIAYGIRPMVFAAMNAYEITKDTIYLNIALESAMWFFGKNAAEENMYNPGTGIAYDGITAYKKINRNSGAESTIEALLALSRIESNKTAKAKLIDMLKK